MKQNRTTYFIAFVLLIIGWFGWRLTFYNAGPQIIEVFPGARPHFSPVYSPDPTISSAIRHFDPTYFGEDESLGFHLSDSEELLNLDERFSRLTHLNLNSVRFIRCKITKLPHTTMSSRFPGFEVFFPSYILFDDCDFSRLPPEERARLRRYDKSEPKKFSMGGV